MIVMKKKMATKRSMSKGKGPASYSGPQKRGDPSGPINPTKPVSNTPAIRIKGGDGGSAQNRSTTVGAAPPQLGGWRAQCPTGDNNPVF